MPVKSVKIQIFAVFFLAVEKGKILPDTHMGKNRGIQPVLIAVLIKIFHHI